MWWQTDSVYLHKLSIGMGVIFIGLGGFGVTNGVDVIGGGRSETIKNIYHKCQE